MRFIAIFLLFLISLCAVAMTPQKVCEKPSDYSDWAPSMRAEFDEACLYAGQYEISALPDREVTKAGVFREGEKAVYNYENFAVSFAESLGALNRPEVCDPKNPRVAYPSVMLENTATGTIPISVISEEELNKIYLEMAEDPAYAFDVPEEGCWARTLMMTRALEKRGIRSAKFFAEGPFWVPSKDNDGVSPGKRWAYHVAPMVAVKTATGIEMRVIDPSVFDKPVTAKKWSDSMLGYAEEKSTAKLYVTDRFVTEPILDGSLQNILNDPARDRWHKAETIMAEQELKRLRQEGDDRAAMREFFATEEALEGEF